MHSLTLTFRSALKLHLAVLAIFSLTLFSPSAIAGGKFFCFTYFEKPLSESEALEKIRQIKSRLNYVGIVLENNSMTSSPFVEHQKSLEKKFTKVEKLYTNNKGIKESSFSKIYTEFDSLLDKMLKVIIANGASTSNLIGASGNTYEVNLMFSTYKNESKGDPFGTNVRYLTSQQRDNIEVFVKGGRLVNHSGELTHTQGGIYAMDRFGRFFILELHINGMLHHSTILGGRPVAAAGEITVNDGVITNINRRSGHYKPPKSSLTQVVKEFKSRGVNIPRTTIDFDF